MVEKSEEIKILKNTYDITHDELIAFLGASSGEKLQFFESDEDGSVKFTTVETIKLI